MKPKILLIEDCEFNANYIQTIAKSIGWELDRFSCPETFLKTANIDDYDIAFIDMGMPDGIMNGLELCKILKKKSNVPLIMCSAYLFGEEKKVLQYVEECLMKPVKIEAFKNIVNKYCIKSN